MNIISQHFHNWERNFLGKWKREYKKEGKEKEKEKEKEEEEEDNNNNNNNQQPTTTTRTITRFKPDLNISKHQ